ncbi:haloacid dehalogenase [Acidilobus sp. 7A]|jgi:translin|nr:haloacid dehalogenase [Acidilobus sp. 7A]
MLQSVSLKEAIASTVDRVDRLLKALDSDREEIAKISRDVIRFSGWSITYLHQGDLGKAKENLDECEKLARKMLEVASRHPELAHSGLVYNAVSEYVEAKLLYSIVVEGRVPAFEELNVHPVPYLQGLGDVVGELRRYALEKVRQGYMSEAWAALEIMESIYTSMRSLDYPDSVLPGVRHKVDVARGLIDDTKAMLVDIQSREELKRSIEDAKAAAERK